MSNMYPEYEGKTINFIMGKCPHDCYYCYVKSFKFGFLKEKYSGKQRLNELAFRRNLGRYKQWFICSCSDIATIPDKWIIRILDHLNNKFPKNAYLIQSKNPKRLYDFLDKFPKKTILGTTIETNRDYYNFSKAPKPSSRASAISKKCQFKRMVSIEPILDFDLEVMVRWIKYIGPDYVSIGADSKNHNLPEPSPEKVRKLIDELCAFTVVKIKDNLNRLNKEGEIYV